MGSSSLLPLGSWIKRVVPLCSFAGGPDSAVVAAHHVVGDGQAHSGSFRLCGKKRIKDPLELRFGDPLPRVFDLDLPEVFPLQQSKVETPSLLHGLKAVQGDIEKYLDQVVLVRADPGGIGLEFGINLNPLVAELFANQAEELLEDRDQIDDFRLRGPPAGNDRSGHRN